MSDIPTESLPPEIAALLATTPKTTPATLERLRKAGERLENDPVFQADFMKSQYVENVMQAMSEKGISQSDLARRWGKSRQYLHKLLNEDKRINFTIETMVEVAMLLDRRLEMHLLKKDEAAHVLRCRVNRSEADTSGFVETDSIAKPQNILKFTTGMPQQRPSTTNSYGTQLSA
jgi:ribosome-binding protein aMBF1 (putative translation factor)